MSQARPHLRRTSTTPQQSKAASGYTQLPSFKVSTDYDLPRCDSAVPWPASAPIFGLARPEQATCDGPSAMTVPSHQWKSPTVPQPPHSLRLQPFVTCCRSTQQGKRQGGRDRYLGPVKAFFIRGMDTTDKCRQRLKANLRFTPGVR